MTAQVIGLGAAVEYLERLGMAAVQAHEEALTAYALEQLQAAYREIFRLLHAKGAAGVAQGGTPANNGTPATVPPFVQDPDLVYDATPEAWRRQRSDRRGAERGVDP